MSGRTLFACLRKHVCISLSDLARLNKSNSELFPRVGKCNPLLNSRVYGNDLFSALLVLVLTFSYAHILIVERPIILL
jgi:hypothetical protein